MIPIPSFKNDPSMESGHGIKLQNPPGRKNGAIHCAVAGWVQELQGRRVWQSDSNGERL